MKRLAPEPPDREREARRLSVALLEEGRYFGNLTQTVAELDESAVAALADVVRTARQRRSARTGDGT